MRRNTTSFYLSIDLLFIANGNAFFLILNFHFFDFSTALPSVFTDGSDGSEHHLPPNLHTFNDFSDEPEFVEQVPNVTVSIGRDAKFPCKINKLDTYRVSEQILLAIFSIVCS